jgi:hypothetical protein
LELCSSGKPGYGQSGSNVRTTAKSKRLVGNDKSIIIVLEEHAILALLLVVFSTASIMQKVI